VVSVFKFDFEIQNTNNFFSSIWRRQFSRAVGVLSQPQRILWVRRVLNSRGLCRFMGISVTGFDGWGGDDMISFICNLVVEIICERERFLLEDGFGHEEIFTPLYREYVFYFGRAYALCWTCCNVTVE